MDRVKAGLLAERTKTKTPCDVCGDLTTLCCSGCWTPLCAKDRCNDLHCCPDTWGEDRIG